MVSYAVKVRTDPVQFMQLIKKESIGSYVMSQLSCVSPFTLLGLKDVFKSVLQSKFPPEADRVKDTPLRVRAVLGPWARVTVARLRGVLRELGFSKVYPLAELPGARAHFSGPHQACIGERMYVMEAENMKVAEFIQKVYVASYQLTRRMDVNYQHAARKEAVKDYAKDWSHSLSGTMRRLILAEYGKQGGADKKPNTARQDKKGKKAVLDTADAKAEPKEEKKEKRAEKEGDEEAVDEVVDEDIEDEDGEEEAEPEVGVVEAKQAALKRKNKRLPKEVQEREAAEMRLHDKRHAFILGWLHSIYGRSDTPYIVDYGCAQGQLSEKMHYALPKATIVSCDANATVFSWRVFRKNRAIQTVLCNLLYPPIGDNKHQVKLRPDTLVFTEVIEHMEEPHRKRVIDLIALLIRPTRLIITTPNIDYNVNIPGLAPGGFRHDDHRIEYNKQQWRAEILDPLTRAGYAIAEQDLEPGKPEQASFIVTAELTNKDEPPLATPQAHVILKDLLGMVEPLYMPETQTYVEAKILIEGYTARPLLENSEVPFYVAPTIAPVMHSSAAPDYLEHPQSAFDYYQTFGITRLVAENKYMGSRGHVLAFRHPSVCPGDLPLISVISRSGAPFFDDASTIPWEWHSELSAAMEREGFDFVILDGEVLPWVLKATTLVRGQFQAPGECALAARKFVHGEDSHEYANAKRFLDALSDFTQDTPPEFRVFQVLAAGKSYNGTDPKRAAFTPQYLGHYLSDTERYKLINRLSTEHLKPVEYRYIDLDSQESKQEAIKAWEDYCLNGGEGWVVKIAPSLVQWDATGKPVLPMVKVRGRDYLRLIYGIDYLDPAYFGIIKNRSVGSKRTLSRHQTELANNILKCFLGDQLRQRLKYLAAFNGLDFQTLRNSDKDYLLL